MQNSWQVGALYGGGLLNGVPFFTQPGGPFTQVFPALPQWEPWKDWPGSGSMVFSYGPWIGVGCLHSIKRFNIVREFDYNTGQSTAILLCPVCGYCQRNVEPYEEIFDPNLYAVIAC